MNGNVIKFIFTLFLLSVLNIYSQEYPRKLLPGEVAANYNPNDTLWVITENQFNNSLGAAINLKYCDSLLALSNKKNLKQQSIIELKTKQLSELNEGYAHYKKLWEETDGKLEQTEYDLASEQKWKYIFGAVGAAVGILIGLLF